MSTDWNLFNRDMREQDIYIPEIELLITDTPNLPQMPPNEIAKGLNRYSRFIKYAVICCDDELNLDFPYIQFSHATYGKNPERFIMRNISRLTRIGEIVFDPFCGYSTVGVCALE